MNRRAVMRQLRKQMLQLQAVQHRAGLAAEIQALRTHLHLPFSAVTGGDNALPGNWQEIATSLLSAILPARWNRTLNVGLTAWRVGKKLMGHWKKKE